ncbi:hypothetical protein ACJX0J_031045 [Zea mays]
MRLLMSLYLMLAYSRSPFSKLRLHLNLDLQSHGLLKTFPLMVSNYFLIFYVSNICCTSPDGNEVGKTAGTFVVYQPYTIHILYREDQHYPWFISWISSRTFCDCCMPQQNGFVVLINNSLHAIWSKTSCHF